MSLALDEISSIAYGFSRFWHLNETQMQFSPGAVSQQLARLPVKLAAQSRILLVRHFNVHSGRS